MSHKPLTVEQMQEAINTLELHGTEASSAQALRISRSAFQNRLHRAREHGLVPKISRRNWTYEPERHFDVRGGSILIGCDSHFWPGQKPVIWQAFVDVAKAISPVAIVLNGDMFDGTRISRHGRLRGQNAPSVREELEATQERLRELPNAPHQYWTLGNHDQRVNIYLANAAAEMDDLAYSLEDWFPHWRFSYATVINDTVEIRHRFRAGIHAAYNNTLHSGRTIVTGHTHQLAVTPFVDRNGRRYGIEGGMLNAPEAPQFEYTEGSPTRWNAGFVVLTFDNDGYLLPPELCEWVNGRAWFRGHSWGVGKPRTSVRAA